MAKRITKIAMRRAVIKYGEESMWLLDELTQENSTLQRHLNILEEAKGHLTIIQLALLRPEEILAVEGLNVSAVKLLSACLRRLPELEERRAGNVGNIR